jgi:hypothetical protein
MEAPNGAPESGRSWAVSPFVAFGIVAAIAILGAVWEISYYAASPALSGASLGTTLGIVAAAAVFFVVALFAPPNE